MGVSVGILERVRMLLEFKIEIMEVVLIQGTKCVPG